MSLSITYSFKQGAFLQGYFTSFVKDRFEEYLIKGLKGSKIITLFVHQGMYEKRDNFYRFIKNHCEGTTRKNVTVMLPEIEPWVYAKLILGKQDFYTTCRLKRKDCIGNDFNTLLQPTYIYPYNIFSGYGSNNNWIRIKIIDFF